MSAKAALFSLVVMTLLAWSIALSDYYEWWFPTTLQILTWLVGLLFLPGYWISTLLFNNENLDIFELVGLSFAFSISIIPILIFYLNQIGFSIGERLIYRSCVSVTTVGIWWSYLRERKSKKNNPQQHNEK